MLNIFENDAFSVISLTGSLTKIPHVPGRAGELAFAGVGQGVNTYSVAIEQREENLTLIPTSARGGPSPQEQFDGSTLRSIYIPQIKLEDTIPVGMVQGVRVFGTQDELIGAQAVVDRQMRKMMARHDLTLEHLRLGALKGVVLDADGSELVNLYELFDVEEPPVFYFAPAISAPGTDGNPAIREMGMDIYRYMQRNIKSIWPASARIHAFVGDRFFNALTSSPNFLRSGDGWARAERLLGDNYAFGVFEYGGIFWENYRGTDDAGETDSPVVGIHPDDAQFFPVGVPGIFEEYYAPADFLETANTLGLPRYAKIAPDRDFNRFVKLHTQQNPMPICTRPRVLVRGTIASE